MRSDLTGRSKVGHRALIPTIQVRVLARQPLWEGGMEREHWVVALVVLFLIALYLIASGVTKFLSAIQ